MTSTGTSELAPAPGEVSGAAAASPLNPVGSKTSLYVGDLDREVTEGQLFELFQQAGPVLSIRVCRDNVTRRSLGYAYVNYNLTLDPEAPKRALETLNYSLVNGRAIRIMWAHRDPQYRKSGKGNVFIKNLDKSIDHRELHDTFLKFGPILSCKVALDAAGRSKGYGFIQFENDESAMEAIEMVNGKKLKTTVVEVSPYRTRDERSNGKDGPAFTNIYAKNLPEGVDTDERLSEMFAKFGIITSAKLSKEEDGVSKGFGFINFQEPSAAAEAISEMHGQQIDGKELYVQRAMKKEERKQMISRLAQEQAEAQDRKYQGLNLYVKNLTEDMDDDALRQLFANHGVITSAKVMTNDTGTSLGYGFVCFSTQEEATKAVTEMNGLMHNGKPLFVALAERKEARRAQLQRRFSQNTAIMQQQGAAGMAAGNMMGMPMAPMPMNAMLFPPGAVPPPHMMGMMPAGGRGMPPAAAMMGMMPPPGGRGMNPPPAGGPGPHNAAMPLPGMPRTGMAAPGMPMMQPMAGPGGLGRGAGAGAGAGMMAAAPRGRGAFAEDFRGMAPAAAAAAAPPGQPMPVHKPDGGDGATPQPPSPPGPAAATAAAAARPNLGSRLVDMSEPEKKRALGELLYPEVLKQPAVQGNGKLAGKITGMLLEMDNNELLLLLESATDLSAKVNEAFEVLKQHNALPDGA